MAAYGMNEPTAASLKERSCLSKKRYWSQVDALVMAVRCLERRNLAGLGTYRCSNCSGWHLTRSCEGISSVAAP